MTLTVAIGNGSWYPASGSLPLIQPSDITFIGYYDLQTNGLDSPYTQGLAVRRVGSEVRLLSKHYAGNEIIEFTLSGKTPATSGSPTSCQITSTTRTWSSTIPIESSGPSFYWDSAGNRLFTVSAVDYPNDTQEVDTRFYSATLTDGTGTTNVKRLMLASVPDRRAFSGIVSVPSSFQSTYSVGPFAIGMGGYTSRMSQRGECAMGLSLYGIPDPAPFPDGTTLTTSQYKVLAARGNDPYGRSLELPTNEYTPGQWQSPGPGGLGYWVWGDKYNGGFFIDGPTKRGLVAIAWLGTGRNWYETSTLHRSGSVWEAHIYDPADLGRISQGTQSAVLDPIATNMKSLSETRKTTGDDGLNPASSTAYDEVNKVIYIMVSGAGATGYWNRIYAYSVSV